MLSLRQILIDIIIAGTAVFVLVFVYHQYGPQIRAFFFAQPHEIIYVNNSALPVTVADTQEERVQGLSGVRHLDDLEGKLFIFDAEDYYGIWMKDMLIPIDIFWIDNSLTIVHIEENVSPDSYPEIFTSPHPARFVLETNAYLANTLRIGEGDRVTLPSLLLPEDLR